MVFRKFALYGTLNLGQFNEILLFVEVEGDLFCRTKKIILYAPIGYSTPSVGFSLKFIKYTYIHHYIEDFPAGRKLKQLIYRNSLMLYHTSNILLLLLQS